MNNTIEIRYINEAIRIRREYLNCMYEITTKEEKVMKQKSELENVMNDLTSLVESMEGKKNIDGKLLNEKLLEAELNINKIQAELKPINVKIESLKKEAKNLYTIIKEKYPDLNDQDIKSQMDPHLIELNNKYKL